jgi:hypothetical protein
VSVGEIFGANLTRCRKDAGLTQEIASFRAGLHRTEISQRRERRRAAYANAPECGLPTTENDPRPNELMTS